MDRSTDLMTVVVWRNGKVHVSADGLATVCGATLSPTTGRVVGETTDWAGQVSCYNCAYRHTPEGYLVPRSGKDFPLRKECSKHRGQAAGQCSSCNPETIKPQCWPCPNGCTDPKAHDPLYRYTRCTVFPQRRDVPAGERCAEGCQSTESALRAANPRLYLDLADSAMMTCYHCGESVCVACQREPVEGSLMLCDACGRREAEPSES